MLLSYLKLSLRLLARNPFFTFINVLGLSVGFAAFFILWQHSTSELKSDQYHKDYERIARIGAHWRMNNEGESVHWIWGNIMPYQSNLIFSDFPEIENHTRFIHQSEFTSQVTGYNKTVVVKLEPTPGSVKMFKEKNIISADPNLFDFFTIPLIQGDRKTVLKNLNSVVLSEKTAMRYFGTGNPINQLIRLNDTSTLVVTGVFRDFATATHLNFDIVLSNVGREKEWDEPSICWAETYVKLKSADHFSRLTNKLNQKKERYWGYLSKTWPQAKQEMYLQPLKEIAFSHLAGNFFTSKSRSTLIVIKGVSVLILIMAWINYVNLGVSRTTRRLKEIATRKVSGAISKDFAKQFLIESLIMNVLAITISLTFIQLIRQPFNLVFDIQIPDFISIPIQTWIVALGFTLCGIVVTSFYPAYMSIQYNPRRLMMVQRESGVRKMLPSSLTTFQYVSAFALILCGFIIYIQLNFILHHDMGLQKDQVVMLDAPVVKSKNFITNLSSFLTQVRRRHSVTFSNNIIGDGGAHDIAVRRPGQTSSRDIECNGGVDETFIPFFGIKMLAGRNFRANDRDDAIIISRNAASRLGFENILEALGTKVQINLFRNPEHQNNIPEMEIIGIIEDYPLYPLVSFGNEEDTSVSTKGICLIFENRILPGLTTERIAFRLDSKNLNELIAKIQDDFANLFPESIFNWYFLSDHINKSYGHEKIIRNQIALCTSLAIGIACLGLLGMIVNKTDEKIKEIGIRKVLGAELHQIAQILLATTAKQIILATIIGIPVAYYLSQLYLERFSERITLQWWHFALPIAILVFIMFITIAFVLWKAAKSNPVEALKYE